MCHTKQGREKCCLAFDGIEDFVDPYSREFNQLSVNTDPYFGQKLKLLTLITGDPYNGG